MEELEYKAQIVDTKVRNSQRLETIRANSRKRNRRFAARKKRDGYVRKSFWLKLSQEQSKVFIIWLKEQKTNSLIELITLKIDLTYLLELYHKDNLK